jgi:hypothetical protein
MEILYIEDLLYRNIWLTLAIWWVLDISDYYLTIYGARLYHAGGKEHFAMEGSYELNPSYQKDVDSLRLWSPRFVRDLLLVSLILIAMRALVPFTISPDSSFGWRKLYIFVVGALFLPRLVVLLCHLRNIDAFRSVRTSGGLTGKLEQARWLTMRIAANESLLFAGLFLVIWIVVRSVLILGGTVDVLFVGLSYRSRSKKLLLEKEKGDCRG